MKRHYDIGDGAFCPQDAEHGRMHFVGAVQFCPHAKHDGLPLYRGDGVTPARVSPAPAQLGASGPTRDEQQVMAL